MFKSLLKSDLTEYVTNYVNSNWIFFTEKPVKLKLKTLYHSCGFYNYLNTFNISTSNTAEVRNFGIFY